MIKTPTTRQSPSAEKGTIIVVLTVLMAFSSSWAAQQRADEVAKALQGTWDVLCLEDGDHGQIQFDGKLHYGKTKWFEAGAAKLDNGKLVFEKGLTFDLDAGVKDELNGQWQGRPRRMTRLGGKPAQVPGPPTPIPQFKATPAPSTPVPAAIQSIKLKAGWDTPMQGGSKTHKDLGFVLDGYGSANSSPPFEDVEIYNGVKYLMPLKDALVALKLNQRLPAMKELVCPGFPRGAFNYLSFDGLFDGHFNRLDLAVDSANQVVCVQLVDEDPKESTFSGYTKTGDWLTYNFVGYRVKAVTHMKVEYWFEEYYQTNVLHGNKVIPEVQWDLVGRLASPGKPLLRRVNTVLRDKAGKRKEETRWYVPRPLADLILYCISKG